MGDVVEFPLRVLHPRPTSVAQRWEAAFGRTVLAKTRFGGSLQTPHPRKNPGGCSALRQRASERVASFAAIEASAPFSASR
jgi:hypothetical protein